MNWLIHKAIVHRRKKLIYLFFIYFSINKPIPLRRPKKSIPLPRTIPKTTKDEMIKSIGSIYRLIKPNNLVVRIIILEDINIMHQRWW